MCNNTIAVSNRIPRSARGCETPPLITILQSGANHTNSASNKSSCFLYATKTAIHPRNRSLPSYKHQHHDTHNIGNNERTTNFVERYIGTHETPALRQKSPGTVTSLIESVQPEQKRGQKKMWMKLLGGEQHVMMRRGWRGPRTNLSTRFGRGFRMGPFPWARMSAFRFDCDVCPKIWLI